MIENLDEKCVMDGQHAHNGSAMFNPDDAPGPMCDRHKNQWLRENRHKELNQIDRDYTHPDKRTPAWREQKAHEAAYYRHRIQCGCGHL